MFQRAGSLVSPWVPTLAVIVLAMGVGALSGCGQKGPLRLAAPAPAASAASAPTR